MWVCSPQHNRCVYFVQLLLSLQYSSRHSGLLLLIVCNGLLLTKAFNVPKNALAPLENAVVGQDEQEQQQQQQILFVRERRQLVGYKQNQQQNAQVEASNTDFDLELAEVNVFRPLFQYRVARVQNG